MHLCFCWAGEMNPTSADIVSLGLLSQWRNFFSALTFVSQQSHLCTNNTDIKLVLMMPLRLTVFHGYFSFEERSWKNSEKLRYVCGLLLVSVLFFHKNSVLVLHK